MPYSSVSEVPDYVPKAKRKQWMEVWNSVYGEHKNESRAFASANATVKKLLNEEIWGPVVDLIREIANNKISGTSLVHYTPQGDPDHCEDCRYYETGSICTEVKVQLDSMVPENAAGQKVVTAKGWCDYWEKVHKIVAARAAGGAMSKMAKFKRFIPLMKVDEASHEVGGIVTAELHRNADGKLEKAKDKDGEICHFATTVPYYKEWSEEIAKASKGKNLGNLREMHGLAAAGAGKAIQFNNDEKSIFMMFKVVDDDAWTKCQEGVYTGFSQGGAYVKRWQEDGDTYYTAKPSEISLVDNPALGDAHFDFVRADGTIEMRKFAKAACECDCAECEDGDCADCSCPNCDCTGCKCAKVATSEMVKRLTEDEVAGLLFMKKEKKQVGVRYLVSDSGDYGYLPYTKKDGKLNHKLMSAAWAALHEGYRGKSYEGPEKEKAITKLKNLYSKEDLATPSEKIAKQVLVLIDKVAVDMKLEKGMYEVGRFADLLCSLAYIRMSAEYEREREKDDSKLPEELQQDLEAMAETFLSMAQEETKELIESASEAGKGGVLMATTTIAALAKMAEDLAKDPAELAKRVKGVMEHVHSMHAAHKAFHAKVHKAHDARQKEFGEHVSKLHKILGVEEADTEGDDEPTAAGAVPAGATKPDYSFKAEQITALTAALKAAGVPDEKIAAALTSAQEGDKPVTKADLVAFGEKMFNAGAQVILKALAKDAGDGEEDGEDGEDANKKKKTAKADGIGDRTQIPTPAAGTAPVMRVMPVKKVEDTGTEPASGAASATPLKQEDVTAALQGNTEAALKLMKGATSTEMPITVAASLGKYAR